jgi:hypothetical protein
MKMLSVLFIALTFTLGFYIEKPLADSVHYACGEDCNCGPR